MPPGSWRLSTAAILRQPSIVRNLICPLNTRLKSGISAGGSCLDGCGAVRLALRERARARPRGTGGAAGGAGGERHRRRSAVLRPAEGAPLRAAPAPAVALPVERENPHAVARGFGHGCAEVGAAIRADCAEDPDRRAAHDLGGGVEALDLKAHAIRGPHGLVVDISLDLRPLPAARHLPLEPKVAREALGGVDLGRDSDGACEERRDRERCDSPPHRCVSYFVPLKAGTRRTSARISPSAFTRRYAPNRSRQRVR